MTTKPPPGETEMRKPDDGWLTRERALALALLAATALAAYVCYLLARPFLPALAWALALAVVAHPLHEWIAARVRGPVALAVTVALFDVWRRRTAGGRAADADHP